MKASLLIIWDYDAAIGQVNASYPYKFDEKKIFDEIENVEYLLKLGTKLNIQMTFACTGFAGEPGVFPYHVPHQIARIHDAGHEVASHSWRHEWFPFLEREQIVRSLTRSKETLEKCIGKPHSVCGFVPPFSRPMSWYSRGVLSFGDRAFRPGHPGASLGSLLTIAEQVGYSWVRVVYSPILRKVFGSDGVALRDAWRRNGKVVCVPQHYNGFDERARQLLDQAVAESGVLVITGHPSGLSRLKEENVQHVNTFLEYAARLQSERKLEISSVQRYLVGTERRELAN
ncbi:hypothetical protein FBQ87_16770 [Sphingobacteriales bacterium CHB3]|nr:hypothetical protein [Sphingobacteriales bacterium CHB3]